MEEKEMRVMRVMRNIAAKEDLHKIIEQNASVSRLQKRFLAECSGQDINKEASARLMLGL